LTSSITQDFLPGSAFAPRGACCVEVVDPGAPQMLDHGGCFMPSLRAAMT